MSEYAYRRPISFRVNASMEVMIADLCRYYQMPVADMCRELVRSKWQEIQPEPNTAQEPRKRTRRTRKSR